MARDSIHVFYILIYLDKPKSQNLDSLYIYIYLEKYLEIYTCKSILYLFYLSKYLSIYLEKLIWWTQFL